MMIMMSSSCDVRRRIHRRHKNIESTAMMIVVVIIAATLVLLFSTTTQVVNAQQQQQQQRQATTTTTTKNPHCNICKYANSPIAYELGSPSAVLATLGSMTMTCEEAQDYAFQLNGLPGLTVEQCEMAQMLAGSGTCGCPNEPPPPVVAASSSSSSTASSSSSVTGRQDGGGNNPVCVLCLSGNEPTMNGFIGGLQCLELAFDGLAGDLNTEECFLSQLAADSISNVCGCRADPTSAPVSPPPPFTSVPTAPPTALPSASPTVRPTPEPTLPPTLRPTPGTFIGLL